MSYRISRIALNFVKQSHLWWDWWAYKIIARTSDKIPATGVQNKVSVEAAK